MDNSKKCIYTFFYKIFNEMKISNIFIYEI